MLTIMEREYIEKKACEELDKYRFGDEVAVIQIAKDNDFVVAQAKLKSYEQGLIFVNMQEEEILGIKTQKLIIVNSELSMEDRRFVVAHELGHYFLHYKGEQLYAHRDNVKGKEGKEQDVDYFAACLLMPSDTFKSYFGEISQHMDKNNTINEISKKFNVPLDSVKRRIEELQLTYGSN